MSIVSVRKLRAGDQIFWDGAVHTVHGVTTNRVNEAVDVSLIRSSGEVISYVFPWEGSVALAKTNMRIRARNICKGDRIYDGGDPCYVMEVERRGNRVLIMVMRRGRKYELNTDADCYYELAPETEPVEAVKNQPHYTEGGIEPIDYMRAKLTPEQFEGFLIDNAIKYLSRARLKGEREKDYAKALWYVQVLNGQDPRKESKP